MGKLSLYIIVMLVSVSCGFNVELVTCTSDYKECFVVGKFEDLRTCNQFNTRYQWTCDETVSPIICREYKSSISTSYCK